MVNRNVVLIVKLIKPIITNCHMMMICQLECVHMFYVFNGPCTQ